MSDGAIAGGDSDRGKTFAKLATRPDGVRTGEHVASHLLRQAIRRLQVVSVALVAAVLGTWLPVLLVQGTLVAELRSPDQWGPPVGAVAASLALFAIARSGRFRPSVVVRVGLAYQVVVSFAIALSAYIGAFEGMTASDFTVDRIGMTYVAPWMVFFTVLVPTRPREAFVALTASAAAVPLTYLTLVRAGAAPSLDPGTFTIVLVLPYLVSLVLSYLAARIVHRLGVEVRRAHELGSYRLDGLLGRGGMGEVWRASHHTLARPAAIKLVRRDALGADPAAADLAAARFEREAQAIASLQSPHTIELYDFGTTADGTLYYVMELLDGIDLEELVRRFGPMPPERVVHVLRQACESLEEAHARGVIHRDIKPANIYLCRRALEHDVVKVLDFGLVRHLARPDGAEGRLTRAEVVAGTPAYLAPELALGVDDVDGRADLYALGCVGFWLLTGRPVFEAPTAPALIVAHAREQPPRPSTYTELAVPPELDQIVLDCLAKDPSDRPQTAARLAARLDAVPVEHPWTQERAVAWWTAHRSQEGQPISR
ncbi:MAG: serine/threonine protein kinase [Gemmatimonadota bacterium]|nr:serine/threonine protein kinase [Gemmatimonadota bacterium]